MATTFTRMDESTAEQWALIGRETMRNQPRVADEVLSMLTRLEDITDGFATNQLVHSLQTATLAERAGADEEMVVASLCHDIGKVVSVFGHPDIAAAILKPYVRDDVYQVIKAHQDFQGRHYYHHFGGDVNARDRHQGRSWYSMAEQFADEWDQVAFDPDGPYEPLDHFAPMVRRVFAATRDQRAAAHADGGDQ
ncbi:MAG: HD domain-containing protein [Acidimicrobiia bacterium]